MNETKVHSWQEFLYYRQIDEFGLPRAARRRLSAGGNVGAALPRLHAEAQKACLRLQNRMRGRQFVMWVDNWYWKRYSTDPATANRSMNTSATAVLGTSVRDTDNTSFTTITLSTCAQIQMPCKGGCPLPLDFKLMTKGRSTLSKIDPNA